MQHDIGLPTASRPDGFERLAIEVIRLALADLHATCERSRATAIAFFLRDGDDSTLVLWAPILGLDVAAVRAAVQRRLGDPNASALDGGLRRQSAGWRAGFAERRRAAHARRRMAASEARDATA